MSVQFNQTYPLTSVAEIIRSYPNPQIIEWFIGEDGLKVPTTRFTANLPAISTMSPRLIGFMI
jgi:hypothetical protein